MRAMTVEVIPELPQLVLEIDGRPEERAIQIFAPNRCNQPLHERMRQGKVWHRFDLGHLQDSQIGLPLPKSIKRIVVRAEVPRPGRVASNGLIEHSAECDSVDHSGLDTEPSGSAIWPIRTGTDRYSRGCPSGVQ
jgi:hypothetical protein